MQITANLNPDIYGKTFSCEKTKTLNGSWEKFAKDRSTYARWLGLTKPACNNKTNYLS